MDIENNKSKNFDEKKAGELGMAGATVQSTLDRGAAVYEQAKETAADMYAKTTEAVSETYDKAKSYSTENPGTVILIALGLGVGLGFLLSAGTRHSRGGRLARPIINALSDIAHEILH